MDTGFPDPGNRKFSLVLAYSTLLRYRCVILMMLSGTKLYQNIVTGTFDMHRDSHVIKSLNVEPNLQTSEQEGA